MYVHHLAIKNIRCIEKTGVDLRHPDVGEQAKGGVDNVNLILGNNGMGKTTLLRAAALSVLAPIIQETGYVSHRMVREGFTQASIEGSLLLSGKECPSHHKTWLTRLEVTRMSSDVETSEIVFPDNGLETGWGLNYFQKNLRNIFYEDRHPDLFLVGYGATRRMESGEYNPGAIKKRRRLRYHRVASLFEDNEALIPLVSWLPDYRGENRRYQQLILLINRLMPKGITLLDQRQEDGEYLFKQGEILLPFSTLSDGYRAYIAWVTDLISHMAVCAGNKLALTAMRGVVLVDEIDLHLHPEWQLEVINLVSTALPNLQFIFTTHSPIVAGTSPHPPLVLEKGPSGSAVLHHLQESIHGMNAEQILLSPYFGMETTWAESKRRELDDLANRADEGDMDSARAYLAMMAARREQAS